MLLQHFLFHCEDFTLLPMLCLIDGLISEKITLRNTHMRVCTYTPIQQPGGVFKVLFCSARAKGLWMGSVTGFTDLSQGEK